MLRKIGTLAFVAAVGFGTAATAETHTIIIMDDAFFPEITYIDAGDKVRFVNATSSAQIVRSIEEEGEGGETAQWTVGPIPADGYQQIIVGGAIELDFKRVSGHDDVQDDHHGDDNDTLNISAELSFDDPELF